MTTGISSIPTLTLTTERKIVGWLLTCYLLLVDVGLRSFISFECPTRCKHRDASWRSRLYQHRQHATVVNSSVTRLCCWRSASECSVAICTSWAYYLCPLVP